MQKQFKRTQRNPNKEFLNYTIIWLLIAVTYLYILKECLSNSRYLAEHSFVLLNSPVGLHSSTCRQDSLTCAKNNNLFFVNKLPVNVCDNT